jgi:hypothetical protein
MAECPSGGVPKAGTPAWLVVAATALEVLVTRRFPWLGPFLAALPVLSVDTTDFCADGPVDMPTWTASDLGQLVTGGSVDKLLQTIRHVAWYEFCECNAPDPPLTPPFVGPPADIPYVAPNPVGQCDQFHGEVSSVNTLFFGSLSLGNVITGGRPLPIGATHQTLAVQVISNPSDDILDLTLEITYGDPANNAISVRTVTGDPRSAPTQFQGVVAIPTGATQWIGRFTTNSSQSGPLHLVADVMTHCGGPPTALRQPCCPPDPTLVTKVDQLLELVTLIQRQGVPFAYVPALTYSGLSGAGEINFTDPILRLRVDLDTLPGWYGMAEGAPDRLFEIGWVALGTADGFEPPRPITNTPFLLPVRGDITRIGYSFGVGIVATITTYSREP